MDLEAKALTKKYGNFYALRGLDLKVKGAKCVGYLGPNGAGKTTTLKLFTHLLNPTGGEALINGYSVQKEMKKALMEVGTLIETPDFYPYLTPEELLTMLCRIRGATKCDVKHALEEVGMYEWRNKRVGKFSKGMKQRIALAAALVANPEILILDEPTTGMDPRGMAEIREVIRDLKKSQRLIFMSSHLLSEVTEVCDEVAMLDHGTLLLHEPIDVVLERFRGNVVEVTALNKIDGEAIKGIKGVVSVEQISDTRVRIGFDDGAQTQHAILSALMQQGVDVVEYRSVGMALEKAYLEMIGGDTK
ncbi:MAG: ABC transporter ATP-binding protein [Euryarchaeota archaeon]|nr:ABC transporter ATP-binding protein [Euryarchaeota archaeon]